MAPQRTCECGTCLKCKRRAYMYEWYRRPGNAQAQRESQLASRERRLAEVQAYDRWRGKYKGRDEDAERARSAVSKAIRRGELRREPCEVCGVESTEEAPSHGHHDDYDKPLEVRWLCRKHHGEIHRQVA